MMTARFEPDLQPVGGDVFEIVEAVSFRVTKCMSGDTETKTPRGARTVWACYGTGLGDDREVGRDVDGVRFSRCYIMNADGKTVASVHCYPDERG